MNLIVDIGNTAIKIAAMSGDVVHAIERFPSWNDPMVQPFLSNNGPFENGIVSTVRKEQELSFLDAYIKGRLLRFSHETRVPIDNGYSTPKTLGLDRLAAAVGANNIYPNTNVLVVDCGTAITIDLVSAAGRFEGGNISLGLSTRFRALSEFTSQLPLVEISDDFPLLGRDTTEAIRAGVLNSVLFEMDEYIERIACLHPDLKVIFTGGDAFFFDGRLKNTIFVVPNLVVQGLNRILEYNV